MYTKEGQTPADPARPSDKIDSSMGQNSKTQAKQDRVCNAVTNAWTSTKEKPNRHSINPTQHRRPTFTGQDSAMHLHWNFLDDASVHIVDQEHLSPL